MRKEVALVIGIALIAVAAWLFGARLYRGAQEERRPAAAAESPAVDPALLVHPDSPSKGPRGAKVTIVEFLDPECEACRAMYPYVNRVLAEQDGRVRLVVRYLPLHANSMQAMAALEAAGEQGRYWEMLDALFANQPVWGDHRSPRPELIPSYARQIGLDMAAFQASYEGIKHRAKIERDRGDAEQLGVRGTPSFFVNGRLLPELGYEPLRALVAEELAK
ncbi:MAG: thioredoxin domain-containing protein [Deltaproteobacteria bacterium]|nr:thioredoxin domain-containing protein [Deltaproteobacteria bacterium]